MILECDSYPHVHKIAARAPAITSCSWKPKGRRAKWKWCPAVESACMYACLFIFKISFKESVCFLRSLPRSPIQHLSFTSQWPELSHMATPIRKEGWEMLGLIWTCCFPWQNLLLRSKVRVELDRYLGISVTRVLWMDKNVNCWILPNIMCQKKPEFPEVCLLVLTDQQIVQTDNNTTNLAHMTSLHNRR